MKKSYFVEGCLLTMGLLMGGCASVQAQTETSDSVFFVSPPRCTSDGTHRLKPREVLIPAAIVGTAALFAGDGWFAEQRNRVQHALSAEGRNRIRADDYIQYVPIAAVYGLNLSGLKGKHGFKERTVILAMSYATMGALVNAMKYTFREKRPDAETRNSFPSGHTATVFMGAEFLYREYRDVSPWIGYAGYAVAFTTGYLRIYNNRHYLNDVIAGACIGIVSTKLAYWLYPKIFRKSGCNGKAVVDVLPYCSSESAGLCVNLTF